MHSSETVSSPTYKHVKLQTKLSPLEIKEKIRKDYKEKIRGCRNLLKNSFRGIVVQNDLRIKINETYRNMFNFLENEENIFVEEQEHIQEIKDEFLEEELKWLIEEYEKSELYNIDWSILDCNNVICPICEKVNLEKHNDNISCTICQWTLKSSKTLEEIKKHIYKIIDDHNCTCANKIQFTVTTDAQDTHMYIICNSCMEMNVVL